MGAKEIAHAEVVTLGWQVGKSVLGTATLMRRKRQGVARTCRHTYEIGKGNVVVNHPVEHAAGEDTAHAATLKYQSCMSEPFAHHSRSKISANFRLSETNAVQLASLYKEILSANAYSCTILQDEIYHIPSDNQVWRGNASPHIIFITIKMKHLGSYRPYIVSIITRRL
jgi:hypothetical protein